MEDKYLLTGNPKIGKTTAIKKIVENCKGISFGGFYTEEVTEAGVRTGFRLVSFDNKQVQIASTESNSKIRVGKYGVDVNKFETEGLPLLNEAKVNADVIVIDEIGPMQLHSKLFYNNIQDIIHSSKIMIGTIVLRPHHNADQIKKNNNIKIFILNESNRDLIPNEIADSIMIEINQKK